MRVRTSAYQNKRTNGNKTNSGQPYPDGSPHPIANGTVFLSLPDGAISAVHSFVKRRAPDRAALKAARKWTGWAKTLKECKAAMVERNVKGGIDVACSKIPPGRGTRPPRVKKEFTRNQQ